MPDRPNIILIITDQQRFDTVNALGFDYMDTPNIDRLVREGVSLDNCFINASVCAPARASLFTGYFPHNAGVMRNGQLWPHTWIEDLAAAGYHNVNIGKMHTGPYEGRFGFHERYVVENKDRVKDPFRFYDELDKALLARGIRKPRRDTYVERDDFEEALGAFEWPVDEDMHPDFFVGNAALWWLEKSPPLDRPLFLEIGFPGPHPPYDPVERYIQPYMDKELPILPVTDAEMDAQPEGLKKLRDTFIERQPDAVAFDPHASDERRQRQRAFYLANVTMIDEKIGQIMESLEAKGYLENAVVIFTSDHGDCLGDHGLNQKWSMYDIVTRVPAIVWSPGRFEAGRTVDNLCQWFDLEPTILELAGVEPAPSMEARSLIPLLEGDSDAEGRNFVFTELGRDGLLRDSEYVICARNDEWKIVEFVGSPDGQLYSLIDDPNEINNLWDDPDLTDHRAVLLGVIHRWFVRSTFQGHAWRNDLRGPWVTADPTISGIPGALPGDDD